MSIRILTSMFTSDFPIEFSQQLQDVILYRSKFVFVASEFEKEYEKTDKYFTFFNNMFVRRGIVFESSHVIDSRMTSEHMHNEVADADVVWLAGGNTPVQYQYFEKYGLVPILREHKGVIIGMSAGAINMAKTAVCSTAGNHDRIKTYNALGLVDI